MAQQSLVDMATSRLFRAALSLMVAAVVGIGCDSAPATPAAATIAYHPNQDLALPGPGGLSDPANVADPTAIFASGRWYLYGTRTSLNLEVWSSADLATWRYDGVIWQPKAGTWNDHGAIWAPHVQQAPDGFYLYYVANGRIGLAFAKAPAGPFADLQSGPFAGGGAGGIGDGVYKSPDYHVEDPQDFIRDYQEYAIDPMVLRDSQGRLTFYCATLTPMSVITAIPMKDYRTLQPVAPKIVLNFDKDVPWEGANREGPWVIEHDQRLYLTYSGNYWWTVDYSLGYATATDPLGPFARGTPSPLLAHATYPALLGPGHNSIVQGARGDWLLFFHVKTAPDKDAPRRTRYVPVVFDGAGGMNVQLP